MRAGQRTNRVIFQRSSVVMDDHGGEDASWSDLCPALAVVWYGTSAERRQIASEGGNQSATFRVLSTARTRAVTKQDRILFAAAAWDIEGITPIGRTEIEFTAARKD